MTRRASLVLLAAALSVGCGKKTASGGSSNEAGTKTTAPPRPVASGSLEHLRDAAAVHADPPRIEPGTTRPLDDTEHATLTAYAKAMSEGRAARKAKNVEAARIAFSRALEARPGDVSAHVERGEAASEALDLASALSDLEGAASRADDPPLLARALVDLGDVHDARHESEFARVPYARALSLGVPLLGGEKEVVKKLGERSRCPAFVDEAVLVNAGSHTGAFLAKDFREAYAKIYAVPPGELAPRTEADAKKLLCRTASTDGGDPVDTHPCEGPPPWRISTVHDTYRDTSWLLAPGDGSTLVVADLGGIGGAGCTGAPPFIEASADAHMEKLVLVVTERHQRYTWRRAAKDVTSAPGPGETTSCVEGMRSERTTFYDPITHHVISVDPFSAEVTAKLEGRVVHVTGASCDVSVSLDRTPTH